MQHMEEYSSSRGKVESQAVSVEWDAEAKPHRIQELWSQPSTLADVIGNAITAAVYGHLCAVPSENVMEQPLCDFQSEQDARSAIRSRLVSYLHRVANETHTTHKNATQACAWWRLDAENSPRRASVIGAGGGNGKRQRTGEAAKATTQLRELMAADLYDMSRFDQFHALVGEIPPEDEKAYAHAVDLLLMEKKSAMLIAAQQSKNAPVLELLSGTEMAKLQKAAVASKKRAVEKDRKHQIKVLADVESVAV